jgi:hypothetical protein
MRELAIQAISHRTAQAVEVAGGADDRVRVLGQAKARHPEVPTYDVNVLGTAAVCPDPPPELRRALGCSSHEHRDALTSARELRHEPPPDQPGSTCHESFDLIHQAL